MFIPPLMRASNLCPCPSEMSTKIAPENKQQQHHRRNDQLVDNNNGQKPVRHSERIWGWRRTHQSNGPHPAQSQKLIILPEGCRWVVHKAGDVPDCPDSRSVDPGKGATVDFRHHLAVWSTNVLHRQRVSNSSSRNLARTSAPSLVKHSRRLIGRPFLH